MPVTHAELAHHWDAARDRDRAIPALLRAGRSAEAVYAFAESGTLYQRALDLLATGDNPAGTTIDRSDILQRAAECAVLTGSYDRAIELGQQAIIAAELAGVADGRPDPIRLGLLHDRLRWFLWESGDRLAAHAAVTEALRIIPTDPPSAARARALGQAAGLRLFGGDAVAARTMATETVEVARAAVQSPKRHSVWASWAGRRLSSVMSTAGSTPIGVVSRSPSVSEVPKASRSVTPAWQPCSTASDDPRPRSQRPAKALPSPDASGSPGRTAGSARARREGAVRPRPLGRSRRGCR